MEINGVKYLDPYKEKKTDQTYWLEPVEKVFGEHYFSFDLKKVYNLFADYPLNLSEDEKQIFDKENPYWVNYFRSKN